MELNEFNEPIFTVKDKAILKASEEAENCAATLQMLTEQIGNARRDFWKLVNQKYPATKGKLCSYNHVTQIITIKQ